MVEEKKTKLEKAIDKVEQAVRDHIKTDRREHCISIASIARNEHRHGNAKRVSDLMDEIDANASRFLTKEKAGAVLLATDIVRVMVATAVEIKKKKDAKKVADDAEARAEAEAEDSKAKKEAAKKAADATKKIAAEKKAKEVKVAEEAKLTQDKADAKVKSKPTK